MKKRFFLLSALTAVAVVPGAVSANLVLDMPPILAGQNRCAEYPGCPSGPCYPSCNDPCVACNPTCQDFAGCPSGPCYPSCADPCSPCSSASALNDTGITWSGTESGNDSACNDSNQDCGYGTNVFNFTPITGGCVQDNVTGLAWSPDQGTATWANIASKVTAAKNISLCSKTDWRAPTLKELLSIVSYNNMSSTPLVDSSFSVTGGIKTASPYWSGTATSDSLKAWGISFSSGLTSPLTKTDSYNIILVSGSTSTPSFTVDNTAGTVTDNNTGLIWKKCLAGLSGINCDQGSAATYKWLDALNLTANGWRLPNVKELQSLVDEGKSSPAIDTSKFPNATNYSVWSSSPYSEQVTTYWKSWAVDFSTGQIFTPLQRTNTLYVRLVKDPTN